MLPRNTAVFPNALRTREHLHLISVRTVTGKDNRQGKLVAQELDRADKQVLTLRVPFELTDTRQNQPVRRHQFGERVGRSVHPRRDPYSDVENGLIRSWSNLQLLEQLAGMFLESRRIKSQTVDGVEYVAELVVIIAPPTLSYTLVT